MAINARHYSPFLFLIIIFAYIIIPTLTMPRYHILRQYITAILLYYFLVFPTGMILWLKHSPEWLNKQGISMARPDDSRNDTIQSPDKQNISSHDGLKFEIVMGANEAESRAIGVSDSFSSISRVAFYTLLLSLVLGRSIGVPFKRYFNRRRKGKEVTERLTFLCKRNLLYTPIIQTGILGLAFLIIHIYILSKTYPFLSDEAEGIERELFRQFFYISLTGSVLIMTFLYSWQKHRVHLKYIEHLFSRDELRQRVFKHKPGRIRGRLWISSGMTTLFPLSIVMFYLFLSLTTITEIGIQAINEEQAQLLFGKYLPLFKDVPRIEFSRNFFYVNAIDSILMLAGIISGILVSLVYLLFYVRWNTEDIVSPVKELMKSMERTEKGQFGQYAMVRTNDEIGILTEGYNQMTERMKDYVEDISGLNRTYSQFVPRQFLDMLGRSNYADIRLGDQIEGEMSVLFSDIRSFTTISEKMSPKESFDYINAYLGWMEPEIGKNNGFIDKYIGDAIMAVFPDKPDDAVQAAISMREALIRFNEWSLKHRGLQINTGIGIHTGKLMMGIVGTEGRLSGTVISDAVNIASRLEGLNKNYGSSVIVSQDTMIRLLEPGSISLRSLGTANLRGKSEPLNIYEVIDGEPENLRSLKIQHLAQFEQALEYIKQGLLENATRAFKSYLHDVPGDTAASWFLSKCQAGSGL